MKTIILCLILSATAVTGLFSYRHHQANLCQSWHDQAAQNFNEGYFADTIHFGTLYLSKSSCRGKQDMTLMPLLAKARLNVPLPDQGHLSAHLMMTRQGSRLQKNDSLVIALAKANAAKGQWAEAAHLLKNIDHPTAHKISFISALQLNQKKKIKASYQSFIASEAGPFEKALITKMARARLLKLKTKPLNLPAAAEKFAGLLLKRTLSTADLDFINTIKHDLTASELKLAVTIAQFNRHWQAATALLTQPNRPMTDDQLLKLGHILWRQKKWHILAKDFPNYARQGHPSSATLLLWCMARKMNDLPCTTPYQPAQQKRIEGLYVSRKYAPVMQALEKDTLRPRDLIDALDEMEKLRDNLGFIDQFQAYLYRQIGDTVLAAWHDRRARVFGLQPYDFKWTISSPLPPLYTAYYTGQSLTRKQEDFLIKNSPKKSLPWRLISARRLLAAVSGYKDKNQQNKTIALAMKTLKPTLKWGQNHFGPHLLLAQAYAHFNDERNSLNHLLKSTELNPAGAVQACRFAVKLYENRSLSSPERLVHWWQNITHIELKQKAVTAGYRLEKQQKALLRERLYILARYAEQKQDHSLYQAVYEKLVTVEPKNDIALNNLAYSLLETYDPQTAQHPAPQLLRALTLVNKAIQLNPRITEYEKTREDITSEIELNKISRNDTHTPRKGVTPYVSR